MITCVFFRTSVRHGEARQRLATVPHGKLKGGAVLRSLATRSSLLGIAIHSNTPSAKHGRSVTVPPCVRCVPPHIGDCTFAVSQCAVLCFTARPAPAVQVDLGQPVLHQPGRSRQLDQLARFLGRLHPRYIAVSYHFPHAYTLDTARL
jgi:hypothetical protein